MARAISEQGLEIDPAPHDGLKGKDDNDEMYETWLYFIMVCVALLVIGNVFCMSFNGKCPWNVYKKKTYSKVKTISSSDEDLSSVEEINID